MESITAPSGAELAARIARREISCEEVARHCLARVAEREPIVRAWAYVDPDQVLAQARALDAKTERGALHGVPVGVKDVIDTYDMPTQMGSPIYAGYRPAADAACVALARSAGALIFGKTVTAEFAGVAAGPTTNPLYPRRTPGGSSSGSAAAVADRMIPLALGTQTGGSVHRPASYCGIVGFKPTRAMLNRAGVKPAAESLDTLGILARDLPDAALLYAVLTNAVPVPLVPRQPRRIALCRTPMWERAQPETIRAVEGAAEALRHAGAEVSELVLAPRFSDLGRARAIINRYQRAHAMAFEWREHRAQISAELAKTIAAGLETPPEHMRSALATMDRCRVDLTAAFEGTDLILAPCVDGEAPLGIGWTGDPTFQAFWTMLDVPSVSLPAYRTENGLPVGVQLIGAPLTDVEFLEAAHWASAHVAVPRLLETI